MNFQNFKTEEAARAFAATLTTYHEVECFSKFDWCVWYR